MCKLVIQPLLLKVPTVYVHQEMENRVFSKWGKDRWS